jgi:seryl-tRNA synthetase
MLDIKLFRENPEIIRTAMQNRGATKLADLVSSIHTEEFQLRLHQSRIETNQAKLNALSREIGLKKKAGEPADDLMNEATQLNAIISQDTASLIEAGDNTLHLKLAQFPNIPDADVPVGDESANQAVDSWGTPGYLYGKDTPSCLIPSKNPKPHWEIRGFDFETATKMSGRRFTILRDDIARLERAITNFMVDVQTKEHGYELVSVPYLVNSNALFGTGQLPKFEDDLFKTTDGRYLIPTAEVSLTNMVADSILHLDTLPMKVCAVTPCFRAEAGAAGRDERGMIRQHQFNKLELVKVVHPDHSDAELQSMVEDARQILVKLGIPHRVVLLSTGDMGFSAAKTYDIEVWLPGQNAYREISSCSNCRDFQARRMQARFKDENKKNRLVHTLNGSGLAVGRTLIAVVENFQREDGSIAIPDALEPYM